MLRISFATFAWSWSDNVLVDLYKLIHNMKTNDGQRPYSVENFKKLIGSRSVDCLYAIDIDFLVKFEVPSVFDGQRAEKP